MTFAALDGKTQAFNVPSATQGLAIGERELKLGLQALPTFQVTLEDVKVAVDARVGGEDGFDPALAIASAQVATAAMGVGMSRAAYEYSLEYAKDREVWGVPIAQKQSIAFMLAEMAIEIESIRLMVWEAAYNLDAGKDSSIEAYLALMGAADMTMMVTDRAVQILGGHGYIREHPVERWMRNGRGLPVFPGLAMV
jgi:acyl-CoA dehydrogenase